jgi:hypothetical protein
MNPLAIWKILALAAGLMCSTALAKDELNSNLNQPNSDFNAVDGPNVRVLRHEDGARTLLTRTPDQRTLTKKKFSASGVLTMLTIYRMDPNGNPIGCKIFDGKSELMYKVSYGYRKSDGQLVEERMFDARVTRRDKDNGKEMPVQRILYVYDAQGNRSAPMVINLLPGKTFEEFSGDKSSATHADVFKNGSAQANPNAKPVSRGR